MNAIDSIKYKFESKLYSIISKHVQLKAIFIVDEELYSSTVYRYRCEFVKSRLFYPRVYMLDRIIEDYVLDNLEGLFKEVDTESAVLVHMRISGIREYMKDFRVDIYVKQK